MELASESKTGERSGENELPFFGIIAAGRPVEAVAGNDIVAVPDHLLGDRSNDHFVLKVVGDSMIEEGIHDGDLVVVSRRDVATTGEMVVALVGDEATLKRFYPEGPTDSTAASQCSNAAYVGACQRCEGAGDRGSG